MYHLNYFLQVQFSVITDIHTVSSPHQSPELPSSQTQTLSLLNNNFHSPSPQPLAAIILLSVSINMSKNTIIFFLWLAISCSTMSSSSARVVGMSEFPSFLRLRSTALCAHPTFCSPILLSVDSCVALSFG